MAQGRQATARQTASRKKRSAAGQITEKHKDSEGTGSYRRVATSSVGDDDGGMPSETADWRKKRQSRIRKEPIVGQGNTSVELTAGNRLSGHVQVGVTFVGMDVHKSSISVAMLLPGREVSIQWQTANEPGAVKRMLRKIEREAGGEVRCCYEAGACGYTLQRQITQWSDSSCMVVAPSLIPRKPGERIKTDRRDARKLAELFRAGLLTEVQPPNEADEAARDLSRAREDAREDQMRSRQRLSKMLLRRGLIFSKNQKAWTKAHRRWLEGLRFDSPVDKAIFNDYLLAIDQVTERLKILGAMLEELSKQEPYAEAVAALRCYRGIDTVTAMTIVVELHTFGRFTSPRELMAFLGLVPSEYSSSERIRRGGITKAGNGHVRRVLIESSWHYRHRPNPNALKKRRKDQPAWVIAQADRAMQRLHYKWTRMNNAKKPGPKIAAAIARELTGFIWATLSPLAEKKASAA